MDNITDRTTLVAIGHSNLPDAFQAGREAAQMAKNQLSGAISDMVLVLGPANQHFQDFIEGVRLVTGEKGLIGMPVHQVVTSEFSLLEGNIVILIQSDTLYFTIGSSEFEIASTSAALTSIITQHRSQRGNIRQQFEHHGLFLIDNVDPAEKGKIIREASIELGLDSWVISITPSPNLSLPLICNDIVSPSGLIGIECLSSDPIGLGTISIESFQHKPHLYAEAIRSAFRESIEHMEAPPAAGFLLFDFPLEPAVIAELQALMRQDDSPLYNLPIVGLSTASHAVKYRNQLGMVQKETIVALLLPS